MERVVPYHRTMLPEQRATSYANDPATSTVVVVTEKTRPTLTGEHSARILLDENSHLVGIDVVPDSPERLIVMLGPHEKVVRTEECRVQVEQGGGRIRIHGVCAKLIAMGANPYVY